MYKINIIATFAVIHAAETLKTYKDNGISCQRNDDR